MSRRGCLRSKLVRHSRSKKVCQSGGRSNVKEKSPAFQWYPKQALGDDKILAMDWDAKGMHYTLLWISWQQQPPGTLPNDMAAIRRWIGSPSDETWRRVSPQILAAWPLQGDRRVNAGMARAWERQQTYKQNGSKRQAKQELEQEVEDESPPGFVLPDWIQKEIWNGYVEMRTRIRKPMTDRAKELAVKELSKLKAKGHDPGDVLNQSILNSWQGLFELKGNANGRQEKARAREASFGGFEDVVG